MRSSTPRLAAALMTFVSLSVPAWLHAQAASTATIYLKEGGVIQGQIIDDSDPNGIRIRSLKSGTTFVLKKSWVDSIVQPQAAAVAAHSTPAAAPAAASAVAPASASAVSAPVPAAVVSAPAAPAPVPAAAPAPIAAPVKSAPAEPAPAAQPAPVRPMSVAVAPAAVAPAAVAPAAVAPAAAPAPAPAPVEAPAPAAEAAVAPKPAVAAPVVDGLEPPSSPAPAATPVASTSESAKKTKAPTKAPSFSHWYFGAGGAAPTGDMSDVAGIGYSGMLGYSAGLGSITQLRLGGAGSYWSMNDLDMNFYDLTGTLDVVVGKRGGSIAPYGLVGGVGGTRTASPPPGFTGSSREALYGARAGAGLNASRFFLEASYNTVWVDGEKSAYVPFVFGFRF